MAAARDRFIDLEKHRKLLEQNIEKLALALDEWRQWKTEYAALKNEVQSLSSKASQKELAAVKLDYHGDLVDDKELAEIFGRSQHKDRDQIISLLANRIDYVSKNVATLEKQLEAAEDKFAKANVILDPDTPEDEEGFPITEIVEELDEDGNVLSYDLRTPGNHQSQLLGALEKIGLAPEALQPHDQDDHTNSKDAKASKEDTPLSGQPKSPNPKPKKKGVSFAPDTKPDSDEKLLRQRNKMAEQVEDLMRQARDQEASITQPIVPVDETEEEAQLRRDMLQYNLSELNPVVAELTLEEGGLTDDDLESDAYSEYDDENDDEDQWGRSTTSVMSDKYHQKMRELQEKLTRRVLGDDPDPAMDDDVLLGGLGTIRVNAGEPLTTIRPKESTGGHSQESSDPSKDGKKSVKFAATLDIAEHTEAPVSNSPQAQQPQRPEVDPLSDVVERKDARVARMASNPAKRTSRFRMGRTADIIDLNLSQHDHSNPPLMANGAAVLPERAAERPIAPSGPDGQTMASTIVEKDHSVAPKEPDEFDASLLQQEVAVEYYKMRNKMIRKQGGFLQEDESPIQPLDESEGGPKRMSRFRAARLKNS